VGSGLVLVDFGFLPLSFKDIPGQTKISAQTAKIQAQTAKIIFVFSDCDPLILLKKN
jgi:hypothetical protein